VLGFKRCFVSNVEISCKRLNCNALRGRAGQRIANERLAKTSKFSLTAGTHSAILRPMKVYDSTDAVLSYQNFGSAWLGILRGGYDSIKLTCNGLFNLRGMNGKEEYHNEDKSLATFWTSEDGMRRFFYNQHYLPREMGCHDVAVLKEQAQLFAASKLDELAAHHEEFMVFNSTPQVSAFSSGTIAAARPDEDFKDAVLAHAFTEKDSAKTIDNEPI